VFNKIVPVAMLATAILLPATQPTPAGEAEVAFLQQLAGQYVGSGEISGEDGGPVDCRLTFKPVGKKLNYTGRCTGGGSSQSFSGSIVYDDKEARWESSSRGKTFAGRRDGDILIFASSGSSPRGDVKSVMVLSPGEINMSFEMESRKGGLSSGTIPFRRG
jgi:hypothetical protein